MARPARMVFLERTSYRRRRMMDALRLVVILGVVLWMIPVLWPAAGREAETAVPMSRALFYIFGVWTALIALCVTLSVWLKDGAYLPREADDGDRS